MDNWRNNAVRWIDENGKVKSGKARARSKARLNRPPTQYVKCDMGCGGMMSWCSCCEVYSNDCCVDYGTCQCS